jgi:UDP-N-acetylmuramyl pentapeptide phosphotransferase/UDP-N-acetylglucosamine-1-phosphate transferase
MAFIVKYVVIFLTGLGTAWLLVPLVKKLAPVIGLVDEPSERRIHKIPIPRCGGLAVFAATHIALIVVFLGPWRNLAGSTQLKEWGFIFAGSSSLLVVGILDDGTGIRAWLKLLAQIAVALLMFFGGFTFQAFLHFPLPLLVNLAATVFWFVLLINAFNLIDGIDGACAGLGLIASAGLAGMLLSLHHPTDAMVLIALAGACLGFLRYNFNPASIFLGDCGSMFIGFMLAAVSLKANIKQSMVVALLVPLLAVGVPVFDVIMAVWRRMARKMISIIRNDPRACKVFGPDLDHIHHKLIRSGMTQRKAAISLYIAAVVACLIALGVTAMSSNQTALLMVGMIIGLHFIVRQVAQVELWTSTQAVLLGVHRPRNIVSLIVAMGWDILCLLVATLFVFNLVILYPITLPVLAICTLIPFATIYFYGVYKTVWTRSRVSQLLVLMLQLAAGEILAFVALVWVMNLSLYELGVSLTLHYMAAAAGIINGRVALRLVRDLNAWLRSSVSAEEDLPCLLLGAGENAILFLRQSAFAEQQKAPRRIVGLVDDNPVLHNRMVYGHPVLGSFDQLEEIVRKHGIREVIFTHRYSGERRERIYALGEKHGFLVREFVFFVRDLDRDGACRGVLEPGSVEAYDCRVACKQREEIPLPTGE